VSIVTVLFDRNSRSFPTRGPQEENEEKLSQRSNYRPQYVVLSPIREACILVFDASLPRPLRGETVHTGPHFEVPKLSRAASDKGQAHDERPLYIEADIKTNQRLPITSDNRLWCWTFWRLSIRHRRLILAWPVGLPSTNHSVSTCPSFPSSCRASSRVRIRQSRRG
jgi:hypothetical protein